MQVSSCSSARSVLLITVWWCLLASCDGEGDATATETDLSAPLALVQPAKIERVSMEGSGCPDGYLGAIGISGTRDTFRINFDAFAVSMEGDTGVSESECTVSVVVDGPDGVAYAPAGVTIAAAASSGATLSTTGHWVSAPERTSEVVTTFPGSGAFLTGALNASQLWSPCSGARELRITLKLRLGEKGGSAQIERLNNLRFAVRACGQADGVIDGGRQSESSLDAGDAAPSATTPTLDAGPPDAANESPAPVALTNVLTAGSACPAGSTAITIAEGRDSFDVDFKQFALAAGAEQILRTSDCSVNLQVALPADHTVAIDRFTLTGSASLPFGGTARLTAYYSYVGVPKNSASKVTALTGPFEGPFELAAEFVEGDLLFRNCDEPARRLNVRVALSLRAGEAGAPAGASIARLSGVRFVSRPCE